MPKINQLLSRFALSLYVVAALVLSACGPGTGGTGTGPNAAGSPSTFTSSYFTITGTGTATAAPTCAVACASNLDTQTLSLHLQTDSITLSSPCATFTFAGPWSISASGESTVQGLWESTTLVNGQASRASQSASLTLSFTGSAESSPSVNVRITDSTGRLLLNSVTLLRASNATPAAATGC
jgi:hypothetical protein